MGKRIRFERHFQQTSFHNPLLGGKLDRQELEIRKDPLTGYCSVCNPSLRDKAKILFSPSDPVLIERMARESQPRCFLCEDRWKQATPTYPEELIPGGRLEVGEAVLFPNLFPLSQIHAVIRVGARHHVPLQDFSTHSIEEAFCTFAEFSRRIFQADPSVRYLTINGNYLGPAGASIIHPHFQVVGSNLPFTHLEDLLARSRAYQEVHQSCYWVDLAAKEEEIGERFIISTQGMTWITAFSPQGNHEILGILPGRRDLLEMTAEDYSALAEGLAAVLHGYGAMGLSTFNFTLYSGSLDAGEDAFRCFLRIISRQNVYENYRTDDYFLQKLLRNELILTTPEQLATIMRKSFES